METESGNSSVENEKWKIHTTIEEKENKIFGL